MPRPSATYRLQLQPGFGFVEAAAVAPYLARLGVSHVYCSPVLQATPGSTHGYDVVDPTRLSEDLGGEDGWAALVRACRRESLGLVVDLVPNHLHVPNPWWDDVLERGQQSPYAAFFDIDWSQHGGRVLLPMLGDGAPEQAGEHWLKVPWRRGNAELNYRRFFDITDLAGVRVEDPDVFEATHARALRLVADGEADGLRIDHPDGLADPGGYLARLRSSAPEAWVVVEKILEPGETLPRDWPVAGTTGYDALHAVTAVLTDPGGEEPLTAAYQRRTGEPTDFGVVAAAGKQAAATTSLLAETRRLARTADDEELTADKDAAVEALAALMTAFGVYRTYLPGGTAAPLRAALAAVRARQSSADTGDPGTVEVLDRIAPALLDGDHPLATRFQQTTGMVMAKGVEDTAFYRYHRLAALAEVGGDPAEVGRSVDDFHGFCARLARDWPATMTTLSTHDTKRSEDVRARLLVLAEIGGDWSEAVGSWMAARPAPDANIGYLFWQTLAGAWPLSRERAGRYLQKASREAKQHTSWIDPDPSYDAALARFLDDVYADDELLGRVETFVWERLLVPGRVNALSAKLLQLAMPGVPDVYQGGEAWLTTLVDPDNRGIVDHDRLAALLANLDGGAALPSLAEDDAGLAKLAVVARTLRSRPAWAAAGFRPVRATGPAMSHAVAFARGDDTLAVATRLPVGLEAQGGWGESSLPLPGGDWRDELTGTTWAGGAVPLAELLATLPVALLARR